MVNLVDNVRLVYVIVSVVLLEAVTLIARGFIRKSKFAEKQTTHWTTLSFVLVQIFMIFTCIIEVVLFDVPITDLNNIGLALILLVLIITYVSQQTLGEYYSPKTEVKKKHKLVDTGIYSLIRHPMYLASLLFMIALPLAGSAYFAFLWLPPFITILAFRIRYEESILSKGLKGYKAYMKRTKMLIPYLF
jgi:protein-S-isoprenylcysteine O-methyltransferase Ste14